MLGGHDGCHQRNGRMPWEDCFRGRRSLVLDVELEEISERKMETLIGQYSHLHSLVRVPPRPGEIVHFFY